MLRSTKAGTVVPATPFYQSTSVLFSRSLNEGRDRSPGDTISGTLLAVWCSSLNEGRDRSPGDTVPTAVLPTFALFAQRRPGP